MDALQQIATGALSILSFETIFWIILGSFLGMIVGAIPGLSSGMAVALLLPLTYALTPLNALIFLTCVYVAVTYGGSLSAILLNTPGAPENAATAFDGYPMAREGRAGEALGLAIAASALGGSISYLFLMGGIGYVADIALSFGPAELFLLALLGVLILSAVGTADPVKALISGALGLLIGTIGLVPTGESRATFGSLYLVEGVQIVPVLIGMLVITELLLMIDQDYIVDRDKMAGNRGVAGMFRGFRRALDYPVNLGRSTVIGIVIGLIPATGATLAALASYTITRRTSKDPESFGKGNPQGIVAAESANNACSGGALMTTLTLGVPGSVATAVLLGALTIHGLRPGPALVQQQGPLVYGLISAAILSQVFMVAIAGGLGHAFSGSLAIHTRILVPLLMIFSILGSYAGRNVSFDAYLMIGFGLLGYVMKKYGYLPVALVMGVMLGSIADNELVRVLQLFRSHWYRAFFERPIAFVLLVVLVSILARALYQGLFGRRRKPAD
ncbi:tripartite tricarboxylate transporter permease [Rhodobium gokarnense]|uniref:Tricarboxylic transport membrane protein n=1 Tax=Rhodobium gokarnense TaxID=364296 RepID=A0ABT3H659_9HYPH|nr:tripartite tricarboxylate transporter permease [Rhodobium gokarnense]MCW2305834.1 putative tricarboxylic transport membrane protein [Rhodobium gokarnense]